VRAAREPLSYAGINAVGLRRRNFSDSDVKIIEDIYRILFVQNNNISNGLQCLATEMPEHPLKTLVVDFVKNSDKGIIRGLM
jgi:UDP-N-acetylglucosamine acyltransferase